jgi:hypothetical protein
MFSAAVRHTAGYSWANNNANYFKNYHPDKEIGRLKKLKSNSLKGYAVQNSRFL